MKKSKNYDRAIVLIQHQVQLFWLVSTAFLITETVILSSILQLDIDSNEGLVFLFSLFGLIISIAWWTTFKYNHSIYMLRIHEAKKFEPKESGFFKDGEVLIKKREIRIGKNTIRIPWHGGAPNRAISLLIIMFGLSFVVLAFLHNPYFTCSFDN